MNLIHIHIKCTVPVPGGYSNKNPTTSIHLRRTAASWYLQCWFFNTSFALGVPPGEAVPFVWLKNHQNSDYIQ